MNVQMYGVQVAIERPETSNRFWAIPIVGLLIKSIILIPHIIIFYITEIVVGILQLVLWIPVLFGGRYPDWGFGLVSGTLRAYVRIYSYFLGLTDVYPPFQYGGGPSGTTGYPIHVAFVHPQSSNRFWAIPIVGIVVKYIILIPHLIVLSILAFVVEVLQLVIWIPVLFGGRYPDWALDLVGGTLLWGTRVQAYFLGLTDEYPPFSLGVSRGPYPSTAPTPA